MAPTNVDSVLSPAMSSVNAQTKTDQAPAQPNHTVVVADDGVGDYDPKTANYAPERRKPIANPGPMSLFGFGMTTVLLSCMNAGLITGSGIVVVVGFAMFHGGFLQLLGGMWEIYLGNLFGGTAFATYGCFWLAIAMIQILLHTGSYNPTTGNYQSTFPAEGVADALATMFAIWGTFTLMMAVSTIRHNVVLVYVFGTLVITFYLLAWGEYDATVKKVAGWFGLFCGAGAVYIGWAEITNFEYGRTALPLFPLLRK